MFGRKMQGVAFLCFLGTVFFWGSGCSPDSRSRKSGPECEADCNEAYSACLACCNEVPALMQHQCQQGCACDQTCCKADCGTAASGDCENCRQLGSMECDPSMASDDDGDGYNEYAGDCDDSDPSLNPGQQEVPGDGIDNDCNGITDADFDGDGVTTEAGDCDDTNPTVSPNLSESCQDGLDNDCDGLTDTDDPDCPSPCELAAQNRSSVGCVYYAVDTNPFHVTIPGDYAVAVSNIDERHEANVVVEVKQADGTWSPVPNGTFTVAPLDLHTIVLDHRFIQTTGVMPGGAYRVTSDLPVIAYQFNPLDGSQSYLSDASLLLPQSSLDKHYIVPGWPNGPADNATNSGHPVRLQIAAAGPAHVRVTVTAPVDAGGSLGALQPGDTAEVDLTEGDVLQLTTTTWMASFSGTFVESDGPVAVFTENDCSNVPTDPGYCCCEHLEEQVFGLQTWGKEYVASRSPLRGAEPTVWQILAYDQDTTVTFDANPEITGLPPSLTLQPGQEEILTVYGTSSNPGDFVITADKPILVVQYMVGAFMVEQGGNNGDPSMVQAVPTEQFLDHYVVLVPDTWENNFLVLTRHKNATVMLDDTAVSDGWVAVGSSMDGARYEVARVSVSKGVHVLQGTEPFGVIVLGFDSYDSYAYPGGLDQQIINPVE